MCMDSYTRVFPYCVLDSTDVRLQTYLGEAIPVVGNVLVHMEFEGQQAYFPLIVVEGRVPPTLLGRTWLKNRVNLPLCCSIVNY